MDMVEVGQVWKRKKDGAYVKVTDMRINRGVKEFQLTPISYDGFEKKGRVSWKWNGAIINELTFIFELKREAKNEFN